jgi:hypothetical protein
MDDDTKAQIMSMVVWGDSDEVGDQLAAVLALGVDGLTCNMPANGYDPERVAQLGEVGTKVVG